MASLFMDAETIRANLEKYAGVGGVNITKLSTSTPKRNMKVTLSNGVKMRWESFLNHASAHLLRTKQKSQESPHRVAEALDKLCKMAGTLREKQEYLPIEYFLQINKENIKKDMENFAKAGGIRIEQLSTSFPRWDTEVILTNGLRVMWVTFLFNASHTLLGTKKRSKENPHSKSEALNKLCEIT